MKTFQVIFQPSGIRGNICGGSTVLEASRELGAGIESLCGGLKSCGKCKVRIDPPQAVSPFSPEEEKFISETERLDGIRLACAARIEGEVTIFIPEESRAAMQVIRKAATERPIELLPSVSCHYVELCPPDMNDPVADFERLQAALSEKYHLRNLRIDYPALLKLPAALRLGKWKLTVFIRMEEEIIEVRPGREKKCFGMAVDVGTTTVAVYLCDLKSGSIVASRSMMNPQVSFGEDVMSRISYADTNPDGLQKLHTSILDGLNQLIQAAAKECGLQPEDLLDVTIVGNTTMHHLLLKISPSSLGSAPFSPVLRQSVDMKARDLGLKVHPSANLHILPIEAGFVGADNVGLILAEEPHCQDKMVLIIDVGTNGELVMGNRDRLLSASCATGPALEGAHIKFGMRAAPGAIERVRIDPQTFEVDFKVVGRDDWRSESETTMAKGICGSGIIDAVAELYCAGIIDRSGRMRTEAPSPRWVFANGGPEFVIAWQEETSIGKNITLTQQDVRNVQLAKAALYAGARLMMRRLGIEKLDGVFLAGAFGSAIDGRKAMILGMFPDCDPNHVRSVGNAAGDGAIIALLNRKKRIEADYLARWVEYLELTTEPDFQNEFLEAMAIPHGKDSFSYLSGIIKEESADP